MEPAICCNFYCNDGHVGWIAMHEPFRHRLRVRWSECDLQGVVFYPHYLAYLDHTVTELWRAAIGPYSEMIPTHGVDMVVAEVAMRYRDSARFDDELEISASLTRLGSTSITTAFTIERLPEWRGADRGRAASRVRGSRGLRQT